MRLRMTDDGYVSAADPHLCITRLPGRAWEVQVTDPQHPDRLCQRTGPLRTLAEARQAAARWWLGRPAEQDAPTYAAARKALAASPELPGVLDAIAGGDDQPVSVFLDLVEELGER